jgi:hypothetical protein
MDEVGMDEVGRDLVSVKGSGKGLGRDLGMEETGKAPYN